MAQIIDIKFQEKAKSQPLNKRFGDITGPSVLTGFRLQKGNTNFSLNIIRGGFNSSVAISPSGAKVEETTDLFDRLSIRPNDDVGGTARIDSVFLRYIFGTTDAVADYIVVEGTNVPAENPNTNTHLWIGYVYVYPNNQPLRNADIVSIPYGFSRLEVAGKSFFHGEVEFDKTVIFKGDVQFANGSGPGSGSNPSTFIERLPAPIVATEGQTNFTLPSSYVMNTQTLFVYKNGDLVPPSEFQEVTNVTFRFYTPLVAGDLVWSFWYRSLSLYTPAAHNHDDLYYRKYEISNRAVRYASDFFAGSNGRTIIHYLGNTNYVVLSVVPTEKSNAVGEISVEKRDNEIVVYNTGTYRGRFDVSYVIKAPYDVAPSANASTEGYTIESTNFDAVNKVYTVVNHKRKDGTLHMKTSLLNVNTSGKYTRLRQDMYNTSGTQVTESQIWAFTYDSLGNVTNKSRTL
jgi:hypothetical protein